MLSIDEVKFGVVLDELPVLARWRTVTVDVDSINTRHVDEAGDTQVEQEVHRAAANPDQVSNVRDQLIVVAWLRTSYLWRAVEDGARQSAEGVIEVPDVTWVQRRRLVYDHTRRLVTRPHVVDNCRACQLLRAHRPFFQHASYRSVSFQQKS